MPSTRGAPKTPRTWGIAGGLVVGVGVVWVIAGSGLGYLLIAIRVCVSVIALLWAAAAETASRSDRPPG
jgi:hypothetical protein